MVRWTTLVAVIFCAAVANAGAPEDGLGILAAELARFEPASGGTLGVAAIHLESGRAAYVNADELFPMASTYKVAIAVRLLQRVDKGELALTDMVDFEPGDYAPGSGTISQLFDQPGLSVSVHNLLELMLLISDNSATDACLELAGGGEAVTQCMQDLGIDGLRVDRSTYLLIADYVGLKDVPPAEERNRYTFRRLAASVDDDAEAAAARTFADDPRDTATPKAMAQLLAAIWNDETLSPESGALLRDIMRRCETGNARLKGRLPDGTTVAHKTGTIGGATNDVGVITLPHGAGHVIVAAFVKDSTATSSDRERAIAEAARAAHDFFLFNRGE